MVPGDEGHVFRNQQDDPAVVENWGKGLTVFLIGMICYRDVFGRQHTSTGCFKLLAEEDKFVAHRRHNDMT